MTTPFLNLVLAIFCPVLFGNSFLAESRILVSEENSLNFLQNMKDSVQKGQVIEGLNEIKHYLKRFGYYAPTTDVNNDQFEDPFVSALKRYQKQYHLNVTGILDLDTMKQMLIPRCGNPDFNTPRNKTRHTNYHKHSELHIVSHYKLLDASPPRWPKYDLRFQFDESQVKINDLEQLQSVVRRAFEKWSGVTRFRFIEARPGTRRADIKIGFFRGLHNDGPHSAFDGRGGVTAHASGPYDQFSNLHYDADEDWSTNPNATQMDLESITVHEIGHVLGLAHTNDSSAVMYAYLGSGTIKRHLAQDDINSIKALYRN